MEKKVLFVDDDRNVLDGFRRQLWNRFKLVAALGPTEGMNIIKTQGPFAVVIADMRMPEENGIQFLKKVKTVAPLTTRMLLTGNADLGTALDAINEGEIFRFLTKPCPSELLIKSILAGLEQYRLVTVEKLLLEGTLSSSIAVLCEILSLVNPEAFGRSSRVLRYVEAMARHMGIENTWSITTATLLSQIGCAVLPLQILQKVHAGKTLSRKESQVFQQHPYIAADLIAKIPRMEPVAKIIRYQAMSFDERTEAQGEGIISEAPVEARILKVALDFDGLESAGLSKTAAFNQLQQQKDQYDPAVLDAMKCSFADEIKYELKSAVVSELVEGMILAEDLRSSGDALLASKGYKVNRPLMVKLLNFKQMSGIREPFMVLSPLVASAVEDPGLPKELRDVV
jgi:response regulator RpfG family c-di-GMP phosphodiesterase